MPIRSSNQQRLTPIDELRNYSFPEWTNNNIKDIESGDGFYKTQDGEFHVGLEDAQQYNLDNYYDPEFIDLERVISDLENTRAVDTGAIPNYLLNGRADPMDSSTWNIPYDDVKQFTNPNNADRMVKLDINSEKDMINYIDSQGYHPETRQKYYDYVFPPPYPTNEEGIPYKSKTLKKGTVRPGPWNAMGSEDIIKKNYDVQRDKFFNPHPKSADNDSDFNNTYDSANLLDYYASKGNPELQRGNSTGFFPTTNYPQPGILGLKDLLESGKFIRKYTSDQEKKIQEEYGWPVRTTAGTYSSNTDQISLNSDHLTYNYGSPGNRYLNRDRVNQTLGHEGFHYMNYPSHRRANNIKNSFPNKTNYLNENATSRGHKLQQSQYHPTMHYIDSQYMPQNFGNRDTSNLKGIENVRAAQNITKNTTGNYNHGYVPSPPIDRFGGGIMARQQAMNNARYENG